MPMGPKPGQPCPHRRLTLRGGRRQTGDVGLTLIEVQRMLGQTGQTFQELLRVVQAGVHSKEIDRLRRDSLQHGLQLGRAGGRGP